MRRIAVIALSLTTLSACTSAKAKVQHVLDRGLKQCLKADGEIAQVTVVGGTDDVLKDACKRKFTDLKVIDQFHASAKLGPYTWLAGIDNKTDVWVLTQADWETMDEARRLTGEDEPSKASRAKAEKDFAQMQKALPESAWIRTQRFENILALRKMQRGRAKDPTSLGDAQAVFDDAVAWAEKNNHPDMAAKIRLSVVDYYTDYASKLSMALDNVGSGDEWLENSIKAAEKEHNKEEADKYRKTLAEDRAKRPQEIATIQKRVATSKKKACELLSSLSPTGLSTDLSKQVVSVKSGTDCSPAALQPPAAPAGTNQ